MEPPVKSKRTEAGFTLIELLVVIGILAVLAAIAIPGYSRFFGAGEAEANATELTHLQNAMDAMMADRWISDVEAQPEPTNVFTDKPLGPGTSVLSPTYLRSGYPARPTKCLYSWNANGVLSQSGCGVTAVGGGGSSDGEPEGGSLSVADLSIQVESLAVLNQGQINALVSKLEAASTAMDQGDSSDAVNALEDFVGQVNAFINAGILQPQESQPLLAAAEDLMGQLTGA